MAAPPAELRARTRRARDAGFTLIELMIGLAIVAILTAIAIPSYTDSVRKSRRAQVKSDLVVLAQRAERYYTLNNSYAGFWSQVADADKRSPREGTAYYTLARTPNDTDPNAFILEAKPVGPQASDTCGALTINQAGARTRSGTLDASRCW